MKTRQANKILKAYRGGKTNTIPLYWHRRVFRDLFGDRHDHRVRKAIRILHYEHYLEE